MSFADSNADHRLEQIRYSLEKLQEETGVGTFDVARRTADFGVASYFPSHEPWLVPEPVTLEPSESYSRAVRRSGWSGLPWQESALIVSPASSTRCL